MEVILNLFKKDLQVGETWNGYRAIVFKEIEDLFKAADIEIHSNVYKIRTSTPKEKTYISTVEYLVKKENSPLNLFSQSVSLSLSLSAEKIGNFSAKLPTHIYFYS